MSVSDKPWQATDGKTAPSWLLADSYTCLPRNIADTRAAETDTCHGCCKWRDVTATLSACKIQHLWHITAYDCLSPSPKTGGSATKITLVWTQRTKSYVHSLCAYYTYITCFCRATLRLCAAYDVIRCLSVCPSVTFVCCVKTSKPILKLLTVWCRPTILVFQYQTLWQYSYGDP